MSQDKKSLSQMKQTAWSVTMWLTDDTGYTEDTIQQFVQSMPNDWALEGQIEQGERSQKNLHFQLLLKTPQTRGTRISKFFPKCHIEEARKFHALQNYVHKADTRVSEFKTVENRSPQWSVVCDTFFDWILRDQTDNGFFGVVEDQRMSLWDTFIGISIEEGMRVDIIGVNPQYRSCILRYWLNYLARAKTRASVDKIDKQTNRQNLDVAGGGYINRSISENVRPPIQQDESLPATTVDGPPLGDSDGTAPPVQTSKPRRVIRAKIPLA